jgi:hypothetical protein
LKLCGKTAFQTLATQKSDLKDMVKQVFAGQNGIEQVKRDICLAKTVILIPA